MRKAVVIQSTLPRRFDFHRKLCRSRQIFSNSRPHLMYATPRKTKPSTQPPWKWKGSLTKLLASKQCAFMCVSARARIALFVCFKLISQVYNTKWEAQFSKLQDLQICQKQEEQFVGRLPCSRCGCCLLLLISTKQTNTDIHIGMYFVVVLVRMCMFLPCPFLVLYGCYTQNAFGTSPVHKRIQTSFNFVKNCMSFETLQFVCFHSSVLKSSRQVTPKFRLKAKQSHLCEYVCVCFKENIFLYLCSLQNKKDIWVMMLAFLYNTHTHTYK